MSQDFTYLWTCNLPIEKQQDRINSYLILLLYEVHTEDNLSPLGSEWEKRYFHCYCVKSF